MSKKIDWSYIKDDFVIFDFETTGLNAKNNKIIEIGALRFNKEKYLKTKQVDTFNALIKIEEKLPEKIIELTGITDAVLKNGVDTKTAITDFLDFTNDLELLAYNADFDLSFLKEECKRNDISFPKNLKCHCVLELARETFPDLKNHKLDSLAKLLGLKGTKHRAVDDCSVTLQVFIACFQGAGSRNRYVERFGYIDVVKIQASNSIWTRIFSKILP